MFEKILVPTKFSYECDKVLGYLQGWKKIGLKEVVLTHVMEEGIHERPLIKENIFLNLLQSFLFYLARIHRRPIIKAREKRAQRKLEKRKKDLERKGLKVKHLLFKGVPHTEILKAAEKEKVSLIVTCSCGKFLFEEILFGSVSEIIERQAKVPVLMIRDEYLDEIDEPSKLRSLGEKTFQRIILPTDFSRYSQKALEYLMSLKKVGAKEVVIINVLNTHAFETESAIAHHAEIAAAKLEKIGKELQKNGFGVRCFLKTGSTVEEILKIAEEEKSSLILMGSHGRGWLTEWLAGTVSLEVVRRGRFPTLVAHTNDFLSN